MRCSSCGFENPTGVRFCGGCGTRLSPTCPQCGEENPAGFHFCGNCGTLLTAPVSPRHTLHTVTPQSYTPRHLAEKILTSRPALEGERKQVTVLFCDVVNSTALATRLGPEAMHALLDRFFALALAEVHRYEGTINQFLGDGFMALFGAPIAVEDHARRALLAALGVQQGLRHVRTEAGFEEGELAVRMGLNPGLVGGGRIGGNLRMGCTPGAGD